MSATVNIVAGVTIKVNGAPLDPGVQLIECRVQDNLMLPDAFAFRVMDPKFALVDGTLFDIGAKVELHFAPAEASATAAGVFKGEVATLAPQFEKEGVILLVRGYDLGHRLTRSRHTRTFQDMTASDIAKKVIGEASLTADVEGTSDVYPFEQQSNESDWDFLWRLATRVGYEVACIDEKIHFRAPGSDAGAPQLLEWGRNLKAFHPRATGIQQVKEVVVSGWDPKARRRVSATKTTPKLDSKIQLTRDKLANGTHAVVDEIVTTQAEADALAQATLDRLANAWLEAEGRCVGSPQIRAGGKVTIQGVGNRFGGDYLVTQSTHVIRGGTGYETAFEISGRSRRTLLDLLTPASPVGFSEALVIGIVTNNDDPEQMGRVRVKFPGLDEGQEGWWARVASLSATGSRGVMMMPLVDDEVVVGFEHGDPRRPFVLGSLWNGRGKPEWLAADGGKPDGSFNLSSEKKVRIEADDDVKLTTEGGDIEVSADSGSIEIKGPVGSVTVKADGSVEVKGTQVTIDATATMTLKAGALLKLQAAQVMLG